MITPDRFIARSTDRDVWLAARQQGVTATMVAKAFTPAGFQQVVEELESTPVHEPNVFMQWGIDREPHIAMKVKERYGIMPNDWLISKDSGLSRWQMATPDGLDLEHTMTSEIKTGGKPFTNIPSIHMRQIQWQLYVTDTVKAVYAYEQRIQSRDGSFYPDFNVHMVEVDRDDELIEKLVRVAEQVQQQLVYRDWDEMDNLANGVTDA